MSTAEERDVQAGTQALAVVLHRAALLHGHDHSASRRQALIRTALDEEIGQLPANRRRVAEQTLAEVIVDLELAAREWLTAQDHARRASDE